MRNTIYGGKSYQEPDYELQKTMAVGGIGLFRYFPKDRLIIVSEIAAETYKCERFYPNMPHSFAESIVYEEDRVVFLNMYDAIDKGEKKSTAIFRVKDGTVYVRVVLSVFEEDEYGHALTVVGMIENVTDDVTREEASRYREQALFENQIRLESINRALSSNFNNVYLIDLETGNLRSYSISDVIRKEYGDMFLEGDYSSLIQIYIKKTVYKPDQELFTSIGDIGHLKEAVSANGSHTFNYRVARDGEVQYFQCRAVKVELEGRLYCVIAFRNINDEVMKDLKQKAILEEQVALINGLSSDYYSVMLVDYQKDTVSIQRAKEGVGKQIGDFFSKYATWSEGARAYTDTQVVDEKEAFYAALSREGMMQHNEDYVFKYKRVSKNGYRYVQFKVAYVELEDGYRVAIVGTKDIDKETHKEIEQKMQLREALAKSEQYKSAVLAEAFIIYEVNLSKNVIEKEIWEERDGSKRELLGTVGMTAPADYDVFYRRWAAQQVAPEDRKVYEENMNREHLLEQFQNGHVENTFDFRTHNETGKEVYLRHTVILTQDEETKDIFAYCNVKDNTENKLRELKVRQYEQLMAITAANTYTGVLQIDLNTHMTQRLLLQDDKIVVKDVGYWDEYLEKNLAYVHPDDVERVRNEICLSAFMNMAANEKKTFSYNGVSKGQSERYKSFITTAHLLEYDNRRYGVVISIDNTNSVERELRQKELIEDALARAEAANKAKTTFLSNMSHDIRTPMNAIIGFTTLATTHIDKTDQVKDYLAKIMSASNHLLSLINDILDMSRIESGKMQLEEVECSLSEIMHGLRNILQADMKSKRLNFYIDTVDVFNEDVVCDKLRLNQVMLNLLGNAIKFTEPGGTISVRICQKASGIPEYGNYEFHVKDTGIGISKDFMATMFEPFERERTSTISGIQGTGLGLPITKSIVEMMGGTIEVHSEVGVGTEFIVTLPMKKLAVQETEIKVQEMEGAHALVVDDDFNTCDSVSNMLIQIGMRAEWTMSGKEAILRAKQAAGRADAYRVYVIDWLVPDMNGIEIARQIRKEVGESAPIIILTAYDWSDIEDEAKEAGVTAFCSKPLFISDLRRCLINILHPQKEEHVQQFRRENIHGQKLLLVEDIDLNREIASEILSEAGFIIEEAENGQIALDMLKEKGAGYYSLVLMDIQMPVMNGYDAARAIRAFEDKELANIPIIAMTADAFEEDIKKALEAGMDAHISKPIQVDNLLDELVHILSDNES